MYHLKLMRGRSYFDGKIKAASGSPDVYTDDEEAAIVAINSGFFAVIEGDEELEFVGRPEEQEDLFDPDLYTPPEEPSLKDELEEKTAKEIKEYAEKHGIDLKGKTRKADMIGLILDAVAKADEARRELRS